MFGADLPFLPLPGFFAVVVCLPVPAAALDPGKPGVVVGAPGGRTAP